MASSVSLLSEHQLQCAICLYTFTDPVSTPCGHNFCKICLNEYWDSSSHCQCPFCRTYFPKRPELCVNAFISELVDHYKESIKNDETNDGVHQLIQERMKKIEEIKCSLKINIETTKKEKADIVEMFRSLIHCIERSQAEVLKVMEEKQKAAERQAEELMKDLEQEITELKRRNTELEQLSHTEDHLHLLQIYPSLCRPPHTQDWTDVSINSHLSVETLRRALSQLQETLSEEMKRLPDIMDVSLDPDTAHAELILSPDSKVVRHQGTRQNLPDNPERFDPCPCVLGKEGFSSGRFYFEVQVGENTEWDIGVAQESVNRKGTILSRPNYGYWSIWLRNKTEYEACESPRIPLSLNQAPQKVGIYVDYEEGLVSFYDTKAKSLIYSFTGQTFTEKLYPYFCPSLNYEGKASKSLIITSV